MDVNQFGSQEAVFRQSFFYTLAFYACFLFATVNRLISQISGNSYFALRWLHVVFIRSAAALVLQRPHLPVRLLSSTQTATPRAQSLGTTTAQLAVKFHGSTSWIGDQQNDKN
jgi:hypothetical protein